MLDTTEIGGKAKNFPTTQWDVLRAMRECTPELKRQLLDGLMSRYWKPLYYFLRCQGQDYEAAKDLVQGFFTACIERDALLMADASRGRFRTFLLTALTNYARKVHRDENAKKRRPPGGMISLDELIGDEDATFEPSSNETPEHIFNRAWAIDLVHRVLKTLEEECAQTGKEIHFALFRMRIIEPALEGTKAPPLAELARRYEITKKQAGHCLLTARLAYQRILRDEVNTYALSKEDAAEEIQNVFNMFGNKKQLF
ncbi:MAG TPA: hypothetical protein PLE92_04475 [Lentisphaeria bacterium]|nr:sigma-70 family RNA polymerase sigma factor [Lentisphaerota bacterium]OQC11757.1 MAG: RNA polymerase sigma factor [Lentisphaerae bacterium ADurb.Bin082]HPY90485.1 hypothetical protein [Lentisphaeria bacterium]HQC52364.1 hypothetical protein [Lentisphaeria bacterium]HQL86596.1 hypothetical protein [Lentisphaeria bacterium]